MANPHVSFEVTEQPWLLPVDALVLWTGPRVTPVFEQVRQQFPRASWPTDSRGFPSESWGCLRIGIRPHNYQSGPWLVVLASPYGPRDQVTPIALQEASRTAFQTALAEGARSIALPVLETGDATTEDVSIARSAVPAAIDAAARHGIEHLVLVVRTAEETRLLRAMADIYAQPPAETEGVELAGGVTSDRVDPNIGIPLIDDQLGVAPYVSMLATVIADRTTRTPFAVGIFGEWGAGKSYFMGLLRNSVHELTRSGNPNYCGDIAQIGFNAWHYADSNLWASLGDEIFRQLAEPGARPEDQRRKLRAELAERLDQRRELDARAQQARATAAELQARLDAATEDRYVRASALLAALRQSPELRRRVNSLFGKLGVSKAADQSKLLLDELDGALTDVDALRRGWTDRRGRWIVPVALFALAACAVLAAFAPEIRGALAWLSGGLTAVLATGVALLARARSGLSALRSVVDDLRSRTRLAPQAAEALDALRSAETDQQVAEAQLHEVMSHIGELGRQLSELSPGRRLYSFLASRAEDGSYQRSLGLISMIRKDFEQLVALLADWRANPDAEGGHRPIDRIVLYIDDLDRCSPRQVVDVLQAVHLLLALDLFVVVLGVDPRWLVRSLRDRYATILGEEVAGEPGVIPEDYLEKIINIPLVLPTMSPGSLSRLLRAIDDKHLGTTGIADRPLVETEPASAEIEVEAGSEVARQTDTEQTKQARVPLTEPELGLLSALDALISTPREAKRLFNIYRMIRATRDLSDASRFLGGAEEPGEFQAVAILLGLLTAHPRLLPVLLDNNPDLANGVAGGLLHRAPDEGWGMFVADCVPVDGRNGIVGALPADAVADWERLGNGLSRASAAVTLTDLSVFQRWVPQLRRFSYRLSH